MIDAWTAVIPIKPWQAGKSRLSTAGIDREQMATAFALDTIETVVACGSITRIVIVSSQPDLASAVDDFGVDVVLPDPPFGTRDRLNASIGLGREWALAHAPRSRIVVIPSDLPALTPDTLSSALQQLAWFGRTHVPDARGTGTTLAAAATPDQLSTHYGVASERAHARAGSIPIVDVDPGVRLDVDDADDLLRATSLGLARRSRELLVSTRPPEGRDSRPPLRTMSDDRRS